MQPEQVGAVPHVDVVVVGAGFGGLYAAWRFRQQGLAVLGLESAPGVGGVWRHNRYPGARVDVESLYYCYYFSAELFNRWKWTERFASQPELLAYIEHVADSFDLKRHFRFNTSMTSGQWDPAARRWRVGTDAGDAVTCRFLVMATGNLSAARKPDFPGLDSFKGRWVQTSHWPEDEVAVRGKRIGVIGTGSSGVQCIPVLAREAAQLFVFQRTPNYSVPAQNRPLDETQFDDMRRRVPALREFLFHTPGGQVFREGLGKRRAAEYTPEEQQALIAAQYAYGGHGMTRIFTDQGTNQAANDLVADYVRARIREKVRDQEVAEALCPYDHPIGTRRLCLDIGYYETFNRPNVTLVNLRRESIARITPDGILTDRAEYKLDLIVFALGFHAFTGAIDAANIRNEKGASPTDHWKRGPRTLLGLMTAGFPNFFIVTGPGSPAVLANMVIGNEQHIDWIADAISHLDRHGLASIEPSAEGEEAWTRHVAEVAAPLLRKQISNYMVHVNKDDGSRVFIPYAGGLDRYVRRAEEIVANGYAGFVLKP